MKTKNRVSKKNASKDNVSTKNKAVQEGLILLQRLGYKGFSFQHIADALQIQKASLYAHFDSKEDLALNVLESYRISFLKWGDTIQVFEPEARVGALFEVLCQFAGSHAKLCPLSALASDFNSLPPKVQNELPKLYSMQHKWLQQALEEGQKKKIFRKDQTAKQLAEFVIATSVGAQFTARMTQDASKVRQMKNFVLLTLKNEV